MTPQDFAYMASGVAFIFVTGLIMLIFFSMMIEANKPRDDQTYRRYLEDLMHEDDKED